MDRFFEIVDAKKIDKLAEVDAPDLVMVTPTGTVHGPEGHSQIVQGFAAAFPNFKHVTARCLESGDLISCEGHFEGDHTGPMTMPDGKVIPATQKHVEFPYAGVARIKNGKVAELHVYFDIVTFMQQLGVMPAPPKTASK
jgi:predicted ester cyclase